MRLKLPILITTLIAFSGSVYLLGNMGGEFLPTLEEGDFALHQILPPGSSVEEGVAVSRDLQEILLQFPEVETVVTKIGTSEIPFDVMPVEAGDIFVKMKPKSEWETADNREDMFAAMESAMEDFPGVTYEFTQPIQMRFNELMTGVRQDIAIKIFGEDLGQLLKLGQESERLISGIDGVGDIQLERVGGLPQIIIDYNHSELHKNGLNVLEVNQVVETAFAGMKLGKIYEGERSFDLVLRMKEENRHDIEDVKQLLVPLPNGSHIPLSTLADVHLEDGPAQISREGTSRRIVIGVNARDRDVESLVSEIEQTLNSNLELPTGYHITYGGQFENLKEAKNRLAVAVPVALLLILFLLYLTFGSATQSLLIFTAVPMAAIGGILSLYLRGMPFSISAGVGFIALFGVAVLNGIVLIGYFNQLKEEGISDLNERIRIGTKVRLRPVFITALVASMGFLPMAISNTAGGEVQRPLATVVIGGLITSTLLTLLVIPILYYYSEKLSFRFRPGKAALLLGFMFLGLGANAQQQLSLTEAIEIAWENNPAVRESALSWEQAIEQQRSVALFQPAQITYSREEFDMNTPGIRSIQLYQQINSPLAYSARKQWRKSMAEVGFQAYEVRQNDMAYEIAQSYLSILYQRQFYQLTDSIYQNAALLFEKVDRRFEVGDVGKLEWMAMSNQLSAFEQSRLNALAQRRGAEAVFRLMISDSAAGLPADIGLSDWNPVEGLFDPNTENPSVAMSSSKVKSAEANIKSMRSQYFPGAIASFKYQQVNGDWGFWGYQIGATIPLIGNGQKGKVEAAKINVAQAEAALESTKLELEKGKAQTRELLLAADSSRYIYESKIIPMAHDQIQLSAKAYELGEISYVELIQQWQNALRNYQSYYDVLYRQQALRLELVYLNGGFMTLKNKSDE
jgi:cobalt-zinc-cadmium resistance protein CzcA